MSSSPPVLGAVLSGVLHDDRKISEVNDYKNMPSAAGRMIVIIAERKSQERGRTRSWVENWTPCSVPMASHSAAVPPFRDRATADIWCGQNTKAARLIPQSIHKAARRKVEMLLKARRLTDLKSPPKNKLEVLRKELAGYHAIRINDQWRLIFIWTGDGPTNVAIRNYHKQ